MAKNLTIYKKENLEYFHLGGRKWTFRAEKVAVITPCNGFEMAEKIAGQVVGALKRTNGNGLDNLARAGISRLQA